MISSQEADAGQSTPRRVEFDIPSDVRYIEGVVELVRRECEGSGFAPRVLALNLPVALSEALSNAILRGNGDDPAKNVNVRATLATNALIVEVRDEGPGFDLDACTLDPTTPGNVNREDGRGLYLMRKLTDRVERYEEGRRNVVRLTLHRG